MKDFLRYYEAILRMALTSGMPALSSERHNKRPPEFSSGENKKFFRACHRGFERAQSMVFQMIKEIDENNLLQENEKLFRTLLLRKIIDSIIYTILGQKLHVMRRLVLHGSPPHININDVAQVMQIVDAMNSESRLTFAVAADISTCVHLCDIVRIDCRNGIRVELIEVKSGKCNAILSTMLDQLPDDLESPAFVENFSRIPQHLQKQAKRMMKQRVRLSQAVEVIEKDAGIDPMTQKPIHITARTYVVGEFDDLVDEICAKALESDFAGGTVDNCIHVIVTKGKTRLESYRRACKIAPCFISEHRRQRPEIKEMDIRVARFVPPKDAFHLLNPISSNLHACACRPFTLWNVERHHIMRILTGELALLFLFDIAGFLWAAEEIGLKTRFSSRAETDIAIKEYGKENVASWGNRMVKIDGGRGEQTLLMGSFGRFANNLQSPRSFLLAYSDQDFKGI